MGCEITVTGQQWFYVIGCLQRSTTKNERFLHSVHLIQYTHVNGDKYYRNVLSNGKSQGSTLVITLGSRNFEYSKLLQYAKCRTEINLVRLYEP